MAEGNSKISSDEDEAYSPTLTHTRLREFYKQGFEAGLEVASEEVDGLYAVKVLIIFLRRLFLSLNGLEPSLCIRRGTRPARLFIVAR